MARIGAIRLLVNDHDFDIFQPQIHKMVPARDSIVITADQAELLKDNSVLRVAEVEAQAGKPKRRLARRGGKQAEVTQAPDRETR